METFIEEVLVYGITALIIIAVVFFYLRFEIKKSRANKQKIEKAREEGLHEPMSLHPVIDPNSCIGTGACVAACPEKEIIGIVDGKARTINTSRCIGHGACFHACPTHAITLVIGTEKRGIDLPHIHQTFETNVPGIFIAGELGGMGLIKNAVEQGKQAVANFSKSHTHKGNAEYDLIIVGAGPAGISASLSAKKAGINFLTLEQDSLGGTIFTYPRSKVIMTTSMDLPLYGKVKLSETNKSRLLDLWNDALGKNNISIKENSKVENISKTGDVFEVEVAGGAKYTSAGVLLALGRRGTPRKLGVPGELSEKVAYRLLEPENIEGKEILIVGGGDSAIESALLLAGNNNVSVSYRSDKFSRLKPRNQENIDNCSREGKVTLLYNTNVVEIAETHVILKNSISGENFKIPNDLVFIFAGGELPIDLLKKAGISVETKFGEAVLKHNRKLWI